MKPTTITVRGNSRTIGLPNYSSIHVPGAELTLEVGPDDDAFDLLRRAKASLDEAMEAEAQRIRDDLTKPAGDPGRASVIVCRRGDDGPTEPQIALLDKLRKELGDLTGEPVQVKEPETKKAASQLIDQLQAEKRRLAPPAARWSGHDSPDYPQAKDTAAKDRYCRSPSCHGERRDLRTKANVRGRLISSEEYDYSIQHQGKPMCRDCQREAQA